jgi:hypothetical protein
MGLVLPSGQKITLGILTTITLEVLPTRKYAPFPVLLPLFKCILEVIICVVFSTAWNSASITSIVSKWRPLSFIFNQGNKKVRWVGK